MIWNVVFNRYYAAKMKNMGTKKDNKNTPNNQTDTNANDLKEVYVVKA